MFNRALKGSHLLLQWTRFLRALHRHRHCLLQSFLLGAGTRMLSEGLHRGLGVLLIGAAALLAERIDALEWGVLLERLARLLELDLGVTLAFEHPETLRVHLLQERVDKLASCVLVLLVVEFLEEGTLALAVGLLEVANAGGEVILPAGLGLVG